MIQAAIDISFLSLVLYLTSLWGEFLFDDLTGFSADKHIMSGNWKKLFPGHWRTLVHVSYAGCVNLNRKVFGLTAHPFFLHLGNVQLHSLNGMFLFAMLNWMGYSDSQSLYGALLFISHPLAVNAVANISGRSSVLSGSFYFLALAFAASNHFGLALCLVLPALWSKEDTITLPLVLGCMAYAQNNPTWWLFFLVPLLVTAFLWKRIRHVTKRTGSAELVRLGFPEPLESLEYRTAAVLETILKYPQWLFGLGQNIDHDIGIVEDQRKLPLAVLTIALSALAFYFVPSLRLPMALMGISPLLVYWFIVLPDPLAEHRAYVSMAGIALLGAQAFSIFPYWLSIPIPIYFALRTIRRQHAWLDGQRLWMRAFKDGSNKKPRVLSNLNWAFQCKGDLKNGEYWAREALKVAPDCFPVKYNLSRIAEDVGKLPEAIQIMETAVKRTPVWQAFKRLGQLYEIAGQYDVAAAKQPWSAYFDKAIEAYLKVIELNKRESDTWNQVGSLYFRKKQPDEAVKYFMEAYRLDPSNDAIAYNLGMVAIVKKDKDTAREWLAKLGPHANVPPELKELCAV